MKKINVQMIVRIALALAMAIVLHELKIYRLPQGGSVTPGSMVPLFIIAFYYGPAWGILTGGVFGVINLMLNPYIVHPMQVILDYPLPFMALGLAGFFRNNTIMGVIVGVIGRFICHFLSGVIFFASYAPKGMSPYVYSAVANGAHLAVEGLLCIVIMKVLPLQRLFDILKKQ